MKTKILLAAVSVISFFTTTASAQSSIKRFPDRRDILMKTISNLSLTSSDIKKSNSSNKPTGNKQRLVKTIGATGTPGGQFYRTYEKIFLYSGNKASVTPVHGPYPVSDFDSMFCVTNESYGYQRFYPAGKLMRNLDYNDNSFSSGAGASRTDVTDYDEEGRLTLDSLYQTGQPGSNLSIKDRYGYDNSGRLTFVSFAIDGYDPGSFDYSISNLKSYTGNDTFPDTDLQITIEDNIVTTRYIKHYYDTDQFLVMDSVKVNNAAVVSEVTWYSYPEPGKQIGQTMVLENGTWKPSMRHTYAKDILGRMRTNQMELYENNQWLKYYRNDKEYTFDTQPDSLPTLFAIYNTENNDWFVDAKEVRTFNSNGLASSIYFYGANGDPNNLYNYRRQIFTYNDHGNIIQDYNHFYLQSTGEEINGYYINFFYDEVLSVVDPKIKDNSFTLFPNPATGKISIRFNDWLGVCKEIRVTDVSGKCAISTRTSLGEQLLDIRMLKPGMYFIQVMNKDNSDKIFRSFIKI